MYHVADVGDVHYAPLSELSIGEMDEIPLRMTAAQTLSALDDELSYSAEPTQHPASSGLPRSARRPATTDH
jgi:hypothetical protein